MSAQVILGRCSTLAGHWPKTAQEPAPCSLWKENRFMSDANWWLNHNAWEPVTDISMDKLIPEVALKQQVSSA